MGALMTLAPDTVIHELAFTAQSIVLGALETEATHITATLFIKKVFLSQLVAVNLANWNFFPVHNLLWQGQ